jgi:hypothetical protein
LLRGLSVVPERGDCNRPIVGAIFSEQPRAAGINAQSLWSVLL